MDSNIIAAARSALPPRAIYADWAARALPLPPSGNDFSAPFLSHPHSLIPSSSTSPGERPHTEARIAIAKLFKVHLGSHDVVLTSGATAALHIVAERLPWSPGDVFICHSSAHTALLGVRAPAVAAGATFLSLDTREIENALFRRTTEGRELGPVVAERGPADRPPFVLFAFPGECNLTGARYPVSSWCVAASRRKWARRFLAPQFQSRIPIVVTLVDAAALIASTPVPPGTFDFVDLTCMSAYKVVGSPTGVGALLIRKDSDAPALLQRTAVSTYFAGGRSAAAIAAHSATAFVQPTSVVDSLELGTLNLDAAAALPGRLALVDECLGGMEAISSRAESAAACFRAILLEELPGGRVVIHYDRMAPAPLNLSYGPIVSFSVFTADGIPVGHTDVATILSLHDIHVRAGAMCNPGALASAVGATPEQAVRDVLAGRNRRCEGGRDVLGGRHSGVIRASFGWASTCGDAEHIGRFLGLHWGVSSSRKYIVNGIESCGRVRATSMWVDGLFAFPVKGLEGLEVASVSTRNRGFENDRIAGVVCIHTGELLNRRSAPALASLTSHTAGNVLVLSGGWGCNPQPFETDISSLSIEKCNEGALGWIAKATQGSVTGRLSTSVSGNSFANRGGSVHIVSYASCDLVARELGEGWHAWRVAKAAKANIIVREEGSSKAWGEDEWVSKGRLIRIGNHVVVGDLESCGRCSAINIVKSEPLRTIVRLRRQAKCSGLVQFGVIGRVLTDGKIGKGDFFVVD